MKYLTIQEIHCAGPGLCEQRIDPSGRVSFAAACRGPWAPRPAEPAQ